MGIVMGTATLKALLWKQAPVAIGVAAGTAAKFGRMMVTGEPFTKKQVFGHLLMMGAIGLAAAFSVKVSGITDPGSIAFTSAIFAIAADNIIKYLATRAWKRFFDDPEQALGELRNTVQTRRSAAALIEETKETLCP